MQYTTSDRKLYVNGAPALTLARVPVEAHETPTLAPWEADQLIARLTAALNATASDVAILQLALTVCERHGGDAFQRHLVGNLRKGIALLQE